MKFIKKIVKKIGNRYLDAIIVSRDEMCSNKHVSVSKLRGRYSFEPEAIASFSFNREDSLIQSRFEVEPFYLYTIDNVSLIGPYGIPVTRNGMIIGETLQSSARKCVRRTIAAIGLFKFIKLYLFAMTPFLRNDMECGLNVVPRHGYDINRPNYCHWILENMPQLFALEILSPISPRVIINNAPTRWQVQSLKSMGISSASIYNHSKSLTRVGRLFIGSMRSASSHNSERDPVARKWVVSKILENCESGKECVRKRRLFISRQGMARGHISNIVELNRLLAQYRIETYHPGKNSFQNDVDYFRNAELIIAPHGAGLANMIFADNCRVIEITGGSKKTANFFYHTAQEFGHSYDLITCSIDTSYEAKNPNILEAWKVNIKDIKNALDQANSGENTT